MLPCINRGKRKRQRANFNEAAKFMRRMWVVGAQENDDTLLFD